jgi:D-arabinose 1-dehydrogenase-like Zn-dependent alcohol dehydrogenase
MCAGITTYNSLRNSLARPGDAVALLGVGTLGHLGVQFAAKNGFSHRCQRPGKGPGAVGQET